jgi:hypothetical protein
MKAPGIVFAPVFAARAASNAGAAAGERGPADGFLAVAHELGHELTAAELGVAQFAKAAR